MESLNEPHVHQLAHPVTLTFKSSSGEHKEQLTELTLRRPKAKDLRAVDKLGGDLAKTLALIARLSGQTESVIDELDAVDLTAIGEIVEGFTKPGLPNGLTS